MMGTGDRTTELGFAGAERLVKFAGKAPSPQMQVPTAAKWLGAVGAIPFVFLAFVGPFLEASFEERAYFGLVAYGAVILSFLGGIHWGLAISDAGPNQSNSATFARLGISVVPSLVGWGALFLSKPLDLSVLATAFLGLLFIDLHAGKKAQTPAWYPNLRFPLTIVVTTLLTFAAFT